MGWDLILMPRPCLEQHQCRRGQWFIRLRLVIPRLIPYGVVRLVSNLALIQSYEQAHSIPTIHPRLQPRVVLPALIPSYEPTR